jgi:trans-aconitate methyltransferase
MKKEFDVYADGYDAAMSNPLKKVTGSNQDAFLRPKIDLLRRTVGEKKRAFRVLDFGCGTGDMLRLLKEVEPTWQLEGTDVSSGMLAKAKTKFSDWNVPCPELYITDQLSSKKPFDLIFASCVFHHIPPAEWIMNAEKIRESLNSGGKCVIFEHNPWNPFTQIIVRTSPIDKNARLLSASTMSRVLESAGLVVEKSNYFLFFPPKLSSLQKIEDSLQSIPLGAQYCLTACAL